MSARNKYRAVPVDSPDGHFASTGEYQRWCELKLLLRAREITNLKRQIEMPLTVNGVLICYYVLDFQYITKTGTIVCEEFKGFWTRDAKLKVKLFEAIYKLKITISGAVSTVAA